MQIHIHETVQLGDLIAAAFDEAALHTSDPGEANRVATRVVEHLLLRARRALPPPLQERKLAGGVAVIQMGATTEVELKERNARVEDALHATRADVESQERGPRTGCRGRPGTRR